MVVTHQFTVSVSVETSFPDAITAELLADEMQSNIESLPEWSGVRGVSVRLVRAIAEGEE